MYVANICLWLPLFCINVGLCLLARETWQSQLAMGTLYSDKYQVWCSALRFKLKDNAIMYWNFSVIYIHIIIGVCFLDDWRCPPLAVDVLMMWMLHWFHGRSKAVLIFWAILMFEEKWGFWKKFHKRIDSNRLNIRWLYNSSVIILMFCLKKIEIYLVDWQ